MSKTKSQEVTGFPLNWPVGYARTEKPQTSPYKTPPGKAVKDLLNEIKLLSGDARPIISSNVPLRKSDGMMYADVATDPLSDSGVAVYFMFEGKQRVIACDKWLTPAENVRALSLSIEAIRSLPRHGASGILQGVLSGLTELPAHVEGFAWWEALGVAPNATADEIKEGHRKQVRLYHPDNGTTPDRAKFEEVSIAYKQALSTL